MNLKLLRSFTVVILYLAFCPTQLTAQSRNVLFIGNSYTNVNNLPSLTAQLALSAGDTLNHDSSTPGGYTFQLHTTNSTTLSKIGAAGWDFVVLQEQSQLPSFPLGQVLSDVFPYAALLDSMIHASNPCAQTVFYMTWGRKNGDASNCGSWPPVCTYAGMDSLLHLRYRMMADSNAAEVSPVGAVWNYIRNTTPGIELYQPDESHPSVAGSYAAACTFYTVLFRKSPLLITDNHTLSASDAATIRNAAEAVVYDSLSKWHIGSYELTGSFTYSFAGNFSFQFNLSGTNYDQIHWDFGFTSDTTAAPLIMFPGPGAYPVSLMLSNNCDSLALTDTVVVVPTGINEISEEAAVFIYPNPTDKQNGFHIVSTIGAQFAIYNINGSILYQGSIKKVPQEFSAPDLQPGYYLLLLTNGDQINKVPFVVTKD